MSFSVAKGRSNARKKAMQALYEWHMSGNDLAEIETQFHEEQNMEKVDVEYFSALLHGVPAEVNSLDELIAKYSDRKDSELDPIEQSILRLSSYEIKNRIDIPYKIIISESLTLAKLFGSDKSHAFVNSVLDKLAKELRKVEIDSAR